MGASCGTGGGLWGWRPGWWRTEQKAYLVDNSGVERPALVWLREYVETYVTGLDQHFFEELVVYPNPVTNGSIRLRGSEKVRQVRVLDVSGHQLKVVDVPHKAFVETALDVASGVYLFQLISGNKYSFRRIVVKEKFWSW